MTDTAALLRAAADRVQDPELVVVAYALIEPLARLLRSAAADELSDGANPNTVALARAILGTPGDGEAPDAAETAPDGGQERPGGREATPGRVEAHAGAQNRACGRGHRRWPLHCTEPAGHTGDHASPWGNGGAAWGEGDAQPPPASPLRDRLAEAALTVLLHLGPGAIATAKAGWPIRLSGGEADQVADAVLAVVGPELDRLRHRALTAEGIADADTKQLAEVDARADADAATIRRVRDECDAIEDGVAGWPFAYLTARRDAVARIRAAIDGGEQP